MLRYGGTRRLRLQRVTYWSHLRPDGFGGEAWVSPVLLWARMDVAKGSSDAVANVASSGISEVTLSGDLWTETELRVGGYVCLGDQTSIGNPLEAVGARTIARSECTVDVVGRTWIYRAVLS